MSPCRTPDPPTTLVVAIDGPAGAGKSTIARKLAERLGVPYLDTGAMYRAVGLLAIRAGLAAPFDEAEETRLVELARAHTILVEGHGDRARVTVDGEDVGEAIRTPECALMASAVSAIPGVRRALVPIQRRVGLEHGSVIEGRDIGSVVFPDATLKVFLTASPDERARRRQRDLRSQGIEATTEEIRSQQHQRDLQDTSRADSPLHVARGSVVVDTTGLTVDQVVERVMAELQRVSDNRLDTDGENTIRFRNRGGSGRRRSAPIEEESS